MPEEVKFTNEELKQVQDIQLSYLTIQNQFGQIKMSILRLEEDEINLEKSLSDLQNEEKTFLEGITKKYGQGTLNPETGVFTPTEKKSE